MFAPPTRPHPLPAASLPPFPPFGRRGFGFESLYLFDRRSIARHSVALKRRERDSNPRNPYEFNGFRDRPIQPLSHLSKKLEAERIRTSDLQIRNLMLYPAELQPHQHKKLTTSVALFGAGGIRSPSRTSCSLLRPALTFFRRHPCQGTR